MAIVRSFRKAAWGPAPHFFDFAVPDLDMIAKS